MKFEKVWFKNFRNLRDQSVDVHRTQVFLVGVNGQGKTNFLEALYFLCYGNSFRTRNMRDVVRHGADSFLIGGQFTDISGVRRNLQLKFIDGRKSVVLDNREIKDRKELIYNIPCIVFSYDDIDLVRGEPECRRVFFDQTLSMYDPLYLDDLRHYKAVLKQRNAAIRENLTSVMGAYDILLARYGLRLQKARAEACSVFNLIFPDFYSSIACDGRDMSIRYKASWEGLGSEEDVAGFLERNRERDIKMGFTTSGLHRDRFVISDQNGLFQDSGSTGQLRLASLILRTSQAAYFRKQTGKDPVMLIDDVLLELDSAKRGAFLRQLGSFSQAFFTFLLDEKYFSSRVEDDAFFYNVSDGLLKEEKHGA